MKPVKLIISGSKNAGKSTAIKTLSRAPVTTTTVTINTLTQPVVSSPLIFEYGIVEIDNQHTIDLYATPSLERFDYSWDNLVDDATGLILLVDNTKVDPFKDLWFYLETFKQFIAKAEVAVGVTKMDVNKTPSITDYHFQMQATGIKPPIFAIDARQRHDLSLLIQALLFSLQPV